MKYRVNVTKGTTYRIGTHGTLDKWYRIEKKYFFWWRVVDRFFSTKEEAEDAIRTLLKEYNQESVSSK